jgi:streptogrisin C
MLRRPRALTCALLLIAGTAVLPAATASADPARPAADSADSADLTGLAPGMAAAMRRDLGLSDQQIRRRLATEAAAPVVERAARAAAGESFAGAWIGAAADALTVAITDSRKADAVRDTGAQPLVVKRSEVALTRTRQALDAAAARAAKTVHGWFVDVAANDVVVVAAPGAENTARAFVVASGVPAADVRIVTGADAPRPLYDIRGGDQYVINSRILCSVGFSVVGGFVTAGHCGGVGATTAGFNNVAQGTVRGSSFPGNDYGWVQTNGSWTPQPWVNNYAGGNVTVAGSADAAIGSSVCRSGRTTGWRCGVIQARDQTVNYAQGAVYGLTRSNACAEGGDSGGAWISGNQAQGVTSGGSGNCTSGATMFYQPVNEILGAYGLTLVTTGGGGGGTSRIVGYVNKCIDAPTPNDGQQLTIYDCHGMVNQQWNFAADGTLRVHDKCMDVAWGSRDNGAAIQIAWCNGTAAQRFVLSAAGDLVNPQSNKCVDVKDWNPNNHAVLVQWDCHGGANQKWRRG